MSPANRAGFGGDTRWLSVPALLVMGAVAAAAFALSYQGLATVSKDAGVEPWVLPLFLDGGILASGLVRAQLRGQRRKTWFAVVLLAATTFVSSAINLLIHAGRDDEIAVILVTTLAPVFFLGFTELLIYAVVQHEVAERKPRRAKRSAPDAEAPAPPVTAPARPARPSAPRAPRASAGSIPNNYPFEEVSGMSEDVLLAEFDALAIHPDTGVRGSAESPRFSAVAWRLVEAHGHRLSDLARRAGHADAAKLKDRVRKVREKAPVAV